MKNSYEDYLQATTNFLRLLESTTKIEVKNKKDYGRAFRLWCYMGKPEKNDSQYVLKRKALSARAKDVKRHKKKPFASSKPPQRLSRDKFPISWEDLLR